MMEHNEQAIRDLLQRFSRAFTSGDGKGAAACWEVPALVVSDNGSKAVATLDEVAAFFGGAQAQYKAQGVTGTRADVDCVEWFTPRIASVEVTWPYLDAQGRAVGKSESSAYIVRLGDDGQARITAVVMKGTRETSAS
jgi:hypothetical protein